MIKQLLDNLELEPLDRASLTIDQRLSLAHAALSLIQRMDECEPGRYQESRDQALALAFKAMSGQPMSLAHTARSFIQSKHEVRTVALDQATKLFEARLKEAIGENTPGVSWHQETRIYHQSLVTRLDFAYTKLKREPGFKLWLKQHNQKTTEMIYTGGEKVVSLQQWQAKKGKGHDGTKTPWTPDEQNHESA